MVDTTDAVHGAGNLPFQRRGVQAKRDAPELYAPGEGPTKCWKERLSGGGDVSELGLLSKAWGGQNENLFANSKTRRCVEESKSSGLRRQRAVPKHNVGRNALCQGGRWVVATNAGERRKVHRRSAERQFAFAEVDIGVPRELWEKFKEMPPLFYTKTRRRRGSAAAYERLLGAQHTQAHARPKKAGWRPLSTKNPDVLAAA